MNRAEQKEEELIRKRISEMVKANRLAKKMTQIELSDALSITQGYLSRIEKGLLTPETLVWLKFCNFFQVYPDLPMNQTLFDKHIQELKEKVKLKEQSRKVS